MRRVARLKNAVGVSSAHELFIIGNIKELESSMQQLSLDEGELKGGLNIVLSPVYTANFVGSYRVGSQRPMTADTEPGTNQLVGRIGIWSILARTRPRFLKERPISDVHHRICDPELTCVCRAFVVL